MVAKGKSDAVAAIGNVDPDDGHERCWAGLSDSGPEPALGTREDARLRPVTGDPGEMAPGYCLRLRSRSCRSPPDRGLHAHRHRGHEERGVKLIDSLCERYRAPNQFRDLAIQVSRHHLTCHRIKEMRAETILKKLESLDAFRRPERFNQFLICCEADARGRTGFEDRKYTQADYFKNALNAANGINTESINKLGLKGKAMAEAIRKERLSAIGELLAHTE